MAEKDISPEKKLLNIIEGKEGNDQKPSPVKHGKKLFSLAALRGRLSFLKDKLSKGAIKMPSVTFSLRGVNIFLQVCVVLLVIYLGVSIKVEFSRLLTQGMEGFNQTDKMLAPETEAVASLLKSDSYYLDKAKERNLFEFADEEPKETAIFKETVESQPTEIDKMTKDLQLVGISWSKDPDAIIEDAKAQKTYFVKTGDKINEIKVLAIYKDKVILHYRNEEVELK